MKKCLVAKSCLTLVTPWTVAPQSPLSVGFPGKNTGVGEEWLAEKCAVQRLEGLAGKGWE